MRSKDSTFRGGDHASQTNMPLVVEKTWLGRADEKRSGVARETHPVNRSVTRRERSRKNKVTDVGQHQGEVRVTVLRRELR